MSSRQKPPFSLSLNHSVLNLRFPANCEFCRIEIFYGYFTIMLYLLISTLFRNYFCNRDTTQMSTIFRLKPKSGNNAYYSSISPYFISLGVDYKDRRSMYVTGTERSFFRPINVISAAFLKFIWNIFSIAATTIITTSVIFSIL